jgi:hypothetical protein
MYLIFSLLEVADLAIRIYDANPENISNVINKKAVYPPIDGTPLKIRIRYNSVKYGTRKKIIKFLQSKGFKQLGNTSSWIIYQMN